MIPEDDNKDQSMGQLKDYFEDQMMQEYADKIVDQGRLWNCTDAV